MIRAHHPYRAQQTGYVLPLTLAVLVMLSLIAAQVGSISRSAIDRVMAARERVQAEYLLESAKAEILHMLSLLPRSARGMGDGPSPIIPDGRTYAFNENVRVRFQDLRFASAQCQCGEPGTGRAAISLAEDLRSSSRKNQRTYRQPP